jgi:hypothetical protein
MVGFILFHLANPPALGVIVIIGIHTASICPASITTADLLGCFNGVLPCVSLLVPVVISFWHAGGSYIFWPGLLLDENKYFDL